MDQRQCFRHVQPQHWDSTPYDLTDYLGLMVLDRLINLEEVQRILYRGDHEGTYITRHWRTGQIIATAPSSAHVLDKFKQARTHRVPLHNVLLSNIPEGTIRFNHKVLDHHVTEAGVQLTFRDRPSEAFDLVVAADGLYSVSVPPS